MALTGRAVAARRPRRRAAGARAGLGHAAGLGGARPAARARRPRRRGVACGRSGDARARARGAPRGGGQGGLRAGQHRSPPGPRRWSGTAGRRPPATSSRATASTCRRGSSGGSSRRCGRPGAGTGARERVTVRSLGPLGLAARQASLTAPGAVRVLPAFALARHLPGKLARLRELDGRSSVRVRGQGTEFDALRDYVDGDDVRSIDWRASARRQSPTARGAHVAAGARPARRPRARHRRGRRRPAVGDAPRLDAAMDAALLLAALAARAGDRVDLLAMDRRVRGRVEAAPPHRAAAGARRTHGPAGRRPRRGRLGRASWAPC